MKCECYLPPIFGPFVLSTLAAPHTCCRFPVNPDVQLPVCDTQIHRWCMVLRFISVIGVRRRRGRGSIVQSVCVALSAGSRGFSPHFLSRISTWHPQIHQTAMRRLQNGEPRNRRLQRPDRLVIDCRCLRGGWSAENEGTKIRRVDKSNCAFVRRGCGLLPT